MQILVQDVFKDAMGLIGATEIDEVPSSNEMAVAMRVANVMLGNWSSKRLLLRSPRTVIMPLVSGKNTYTIGLSGCDITTGKPLIITSAYYRDNNNVDKVISVVPLEQYNNLGIKSTMSEPECIAYDPGSEQQTSHRGTIYTYPTPPQGGTIFFQCTQYISEVSNLTDMLLFEPAYYEAFIYNLAVRLYRHYHTSGDIPGDIVAIAGNALQALRTMNSQKTLASSDFYSGRRYNVYTDGY